MKHKEDSRNYLAEEGKLIVRISDGKIMGDEISLGTEDDISNYEERDFTKDQIDEFFESVGVRTRKPAKPNHDGKHVEKRIQR